jgi:hypothetical protein
MTNWPVDLLYSPFGYVWEIKPRDSAAEAEYVVTRNTAAMNAAQQEELLTGPTPLGGTYNWNYDPPRWQLAPVGSFTSRMELGTDISGRVTIVAGQTRRGVILWWKERRKTQEVYDPVRLPDWVIWSDKNWVDSSPSIAPVPAPTPMPGPIGTPTPPGHRPIPPPGYSPPLPQADLHGQQFCLLVICDNCWRDYCLSPRPLRNLPCMWTGSSFLRVSPLLRRGEVKWIST